MVTTYLNDVIKVDTLKEWIEWNTDDYRHLDYCRLYIIPGNSYDEKNRVLLLRHIKEIKELRNKEKAEVQYSIITEVPCNVFSVQSGTSNNYEESKKIKSSPGIFNLHENIEVFLELYNAKKGTAINIEYWINNNCQSFEERGITQESLFLSFKTKKREYRVQIDNILTGIYNKLYRSMDLDHSDMIKDFIRVPDPVTPEGISA
jgi:hypothetical protein